MKTDKLAFLLAMIAGLVALARFGYKLATYHKTDYMILVAGIFLLAFGASSYFGKKER